MSLEKKKKLNSFFFATLSSCCFERKSHVPICPYRDYNAYYVSWSATNGPVELKNQQEQRTTDKTMRRFTLLTFYSVTQHPLPIPCPPQLPSIPPSLPSFPSPSAINQLGHSLGQCQRRNAHRGWRKRAEGLRGEKRDRQKRKNEREGMASFKALFPHSKMQHTNFHVNLPCDSRDGCLWLFGWCDAYIEKLKWSYYVGSRVSGCRR